MRGLLLTLLPAAQAVTVMYAYFGSQSPGNSSLEPVVSAFGAIPNTTAQEVLYNVDCHYNQSDCYFNYSDAVGNGTAILQGMLRVNTQPVVLLGYDIGADITSAALAGAELISKNFTALEPEYSKNVLAIIQISDPTRVLGQGTEEGSCKKDGPYPREGNYKTALDSFKLLDFCNKEDPSCCGAYNSSLYYPFYDDYQYFDELSRDDMVRFVQQQMTARNISNTGPDPFRYTSTSSTISSVSRTQISTVPPTPTSTVATASPTRQAGTAARHKIEVGVVGLAVILLVF